MIDQLVPLVTVVATVGCGLVAGLFLAFSVAVMSGLGRLPAPAGLAAMQSINRTILNPVFGAVFGGTAVACVLLAVATPFSAAGGAGWRLVGAILYLLGGILLTFAVNVPLNNALDAADPASAGGAQVWARYLRRWTAANHVRTVATAAAAAALALA